MLFEFFIGTNKSSQFHISRFKYSSFFSDVLLHHGQTSVILVLCRINTVIELSFGLETVELINPKNLCLGQPCHTRHISDCEQVIFLFKILVF